MTHSRSVSRLRVQRYVRLVLAAAGVLVVTCPAALAWVDMTDYGVDPYPHPNGIYITDGSYVMNVGELHINITNFGLIGSQAPSTCSWCDAPSAQWPAGSGVEYLWAAGLWVGGVTLGERLVSTGQYEREILATSEVEDTIYEAIGGRLLRPPGNTDASGRRIPEADPNDDDDYDDFGVARVDEETLNGYDDDDDGLIDEDFAQIGNQMMVCTMYDNTRLASELYPDHTPLYLKVIQNSYGWENDDADDFVGFEFEITNIGVAPINDVYIGFFADSDIGPRDRPGRAEDDLAGSYTGFVLARDNTWVPVTLGYMFDDDQDDGATLGYFGVAFLSHDTDPTGARAPETISLHSFHHFSGQASFDQGGDPTNDSERYQLLSENVIMNNVTEGRENDYRFLVAVGPFAELPPDETLTFQAALVVGNGLSGLLANAAEAVLTWDGNFFDLDGNSQTGINGRESRICANQFPDGAIFEWAADLMDQSCVPTDYLLSFPRIGADDLDAEGCLYVNMDNCYECGRQAGQYCTQENRLITTVWNCWDPSISDANKKGCTGIEGKETQVHWLVGMAPPPPGTRLWPTDRSVHVFWNNLSETTPDVRSNRIDFESYRLWRADNWERPFGASVENGPESGLWQLIAEYDLDNTYVQRRELIDGSVVIDTLPLGRNTGLEEIRYTPVCLADPTFEMPAPGLAEAMRQVVEADSLGLFQLRPPLYDSEGSVVEGLEALLPWQGYPAHLDTFFWVTPRVALAPTHVAKDAVEFYEYVDYDVHNGFLYFYSVTATDHAMDINDDDTITVTGSGIVGDPSSSFNDVRPGSLAQTAEERKQNGVDIYVYPNPATRDALEEFQLFYPNSDDPTGIRVCFANLPRSHNSVKIYTLDGDLVETLDHDGTDGYGEICWNLVSRNGQEVVSGIYLYTVESRDAQFDDFIGKFVIIR
ncbi:hypothetical protein KKG45_03880 [bacterium]|nr:hypothetical protein [bacterium]MBU1072367.1 hypothetical protein [bacterium]MBU1675513.1 hypothetical protein [bacterium]